MEIFRSDRHTASVRPSPNEEEAAAIAAVLELLLAGRQAQDAPPVSRWTRAGRLEAQGLTATPAALRGGWRR